MEILMRRLETLELSLAATREQKTRERERMDVAEQTRINHALEAGSRLLEAEDTPASDATRALADAAKLAAEEAWARLEAIEADAEEAIRALQTELHADGGLSPFPGRG
jgi:membrane protein involved in colicin uptake